MVLNYIDVMALKTFSLQVNVYCGVVADVLFVFGFTAYQHCLGHLTPDLFILIKVQTICISTDVCLHTVKY